MGEREKNYSLPSPILKLQPYREQVGNSCDEDCTTSTGSRLRKAKLSQDSVSTETPIKPCHVALTQSTAKSAVNPTRRGRNVRESCATMRDRHTIGIDTPMSGTTCYSLGEISAVQASIVSGPHAGLGCERARARFECARDMSFHKNGGKKNREFMNSDKIYRVKMLIQIRLICVRGFNGAGIAVGHT